MKKNGFDFAGERQFESDLKEFRASALTGAERPGAFWAEQRRSVMARVGQAQKASPFKPAFAWGMAVVIVLAVVGSWMEGPRALPAPDFAAGYDDDLLSDVKRLTDTQTPLALLPALALVDEIEAGLRPETSKPLR
jgi:hypothetical protein